MVLVCERYFLQDAAAALRKAEEEAAALLGDMPNSDSTGGSTGTSQPAESSGSERGAGVEDGSAPPSESWTGLS